MSGEARVQTYDDASTLAAEVASALLERIASIQAEGRLAEIGLTGGTIADEIHREVARRGPDSGVDWTRVQFWWGDERFVPADSPDRNELQTRAALLDHLPVDPDRVHPMPPSDAGLDLDQAAAAYGDLVRSRGTGAFDVMMFGVGPDGHVASLFPGFPQLDVDDQIAVGVTGSPKPPPERITLTYPPLNRSRAVWFLVSGAGKADAVASALGGADLHVTPATGVHGSQETVWWLDSAAASRLPPPPG